MISSFPMVYSNVYLGFVILQTNTHNVTNIVSQKPLKNTNEYSVEGEEMWGLQ
jgi:hypothetical protein